MTYIEINIAKTVDSVNVKSMSAFLGKTHH